jgi:cytochrome c oxidase cbb3-type subunit 3
MNSFWSAFVIVITVAMFIGCLWLLLANSRGVPGEVKDHVWDDDLREYNNPLPRWWFNLFLLTLVFGAVYLVMYPGLGNLPGVLGWTHTKQMQADLDQLTAKRRAAYAALAGMDVPTLAQNPAAQSLGHAIFLNNCAGCHGADAKGAIGFPNLTDNDWLFGGDPDKIVESITHGREGMMPPIGAALPPEALNALLDFVPYWSDPKLSADKREAGMKQFMLTCAACHGADGKGNPIIGAPNLTDDIWLFGGGRERVRETLTAGRHAKMPSHESILSPDEIRVVASYVYGLSHPAGSTATSPR